MSNSIKISIPTPCHQNWGSMAPESRGRFCASCRKTVTDFTKSSDREIVNAYYRDANLCGRFRATQLDRDLAIPKEKSKLWAGAAAVAVLALANGQALAQTPANIEQTENTASNPPQTETLTPPPHTIAGSVYDTDGLPVPGCTVSVLTRPANNVVTDIDGNFSIEANPGDILVFTSVYADAEITVDDKTRYTVTIKEGEILGGPMITKRRTFLGRIFHSVGNIFR